MVKSQVVQAYWNTDDDAGTTTFKDAVAGHQRSMTRYFRDLGLQWGIYARSERCHWDYREENFNSHRYRFPVRMEHMRFPAFIKKVLGRDMAERRYMSDLEDAADTGIGFWENTFS